MIGVKVMLNGTLGREAARERDKERRLSKLIEGLEERRRSRT